MPNLRRDIDIQFHEANRVPYYLNAKTPCTRHVVMKLSKIKDKENTKNNQRKNRNLQRNPHPSRFLSRNPTIQERME